MIVGVLPGRGASLSSAGKPPSRNWFRQRAAFSGMILTLAATCLSCIPAAASTTIRAHFTLPAAALRARARDSSMSRCSALSTGRATRIVFAPSIVKTTRQRYSLLFRPHYTSGDRGLTEYFFLKAYLPPLPGATAPALSTLAAFDLNQQEELRALAAQLAARCGIPVQES